MSWFTDLIFGKKPSDSLPSYLKNIYSNPSSEWLNYLQTGMIPSSTSTSGSSSSTVASGTSNTKGSTTNQFIQYPFVTPDFAPLATLARDTAYGRLQDGGLPQGYQQEGLRSIGQSNSIAAKSLEDALTQRGLGRATAAGQDVLAGQASDQNASFLNSLPMLARQNQAQDLGIAQNLIGQLGLGQTGKSAGTSNSTTNFRNLTDTSSGGWSTNPGGFDYSGYGSMMGQLMGYYNAPRSGGLIQYAPLIASLFGGGKSAAKSPTGFTGDPYGVGF